MIITIHTIISLHNIIPKAPPIDVTATTNKISNNTIMNKIVNNIILYHTPFFHNTECNICELNSFPIETSLPSFSLKWFDFQSPHYLSYRDCRI